MMELGKIYELLANCAQNKPLDHKIHCNENLYHLFVPNKFFTSPSCTYTILDKGFSSSIGSEQYGFLIEHRYTYNKGHNYKVVRGEMASIRACLNDLGCLEALERFMNENTPKTFRPTKVRLRNHFKK